MSSQPSTPSNQDQETRPTFWQRPFVLEVMPFLTSLMFHVGLLAIGILTYQAVTHLTVATKIQQYVPDPGNPIDDGVGIPKVIGGSDGSAVDVPTLPADVLMNRNAGGSGGPTLHTVSLPGDSATPDSVALISNGRRAIAGGVAGDGTEGDGGGGTGLGKGFGPGSGTGCLFGLRGPRGASKICYVCDASGSMIGRFDELRGEIVRAVNELKSGRQFFNVIFFSDSDANVMANDALLPANAFNKDRCAKFVESATAAKTTNPIPALEVAFKQHPELIYLLTDGEFDENEVVVKWIADHNKDHKIKINTIHFVTGAEDPKAVLQKIAKDNGGFFKVVEEK